MTKYIRYRSGNTIAQGILDGDRVKELRGDLFNGRSETGITHKLADVTLLYPCVPRQIMAVGLNYRSHVGTRPTPVNVEIFFKPLNSLQDPDGPIVFPRGATEVHPEGELVVVIGKKLKDATLEQARDGIFGVTCGNDVSERQWQSGPQKDLQWWRAKGSDTFSPLGPAIVSGLDYGNLLLQTRVNGEVVQKQTTADLIFDCPTIVKWVSEHLTLLPGDVIFTGTPGTTKKMNPGDTVEIDIEDIGILRNRVVTAESLRG